jgi:hypothetical protein
MKNENVSINIRPVVNGWIVSENTGNNTSFTGREHVFTTTESLGAFVAEFYGAEIRPLKDQPLNTSDSPAFTDDPVHNPDGLSDDVIGVKDGWRLLRKSEIKDRLCSLGIEKWDQYSDPAWSGPREGSNTSFTYRTKLPFGQL